MDKKQLISIVVVAILLGIFSYGGYRIGLDEGVSTITDEYSIQLSNLEVEYQILQDRLPIEVYDAFDDGYTLASSTITLFNQTIKTYEEAYQIGYENALKSKISSYGTGWSSGNDYGYDNGYTDGYDEGLQGSDLELFEMAYNSGYTDSDEYWSYAYDDGSETSYYNGFDDGYQAALEGDTQALGEYTIQFRDLNTTVGPYTYTTGSGDLKFKMGEVTIHKGPWTFIGELNSIVIADLYDPDGNKIGVGGFFGEDLTLIMSPLTKP